VWLADGRIPFDSNLDALTTKDVSLQVYVMNADGTATSSAVSAGRMP
jgi:hypothetical protein